MKEVNLNVSFTLSLDTDEVETLDKATAIALLEKKLKARLENTGIEEVVSDLKVTIEE